ncbi:RNA polymerase sigma factor [Actinotalea solisilvae]|uniref:RNA polymerase sigma factor n=1 Tax=Actinotalea solisilvae TaxID=2072922 RepID=UPI0018F1CADE|nr:sigma-70 family RNA polymerase sigma factor [Actinotalea solisilvae]
MSPPTRAPDRERAFRSLYTAVYPDALRFAQRRILREHAEDVVAEAFLVVWRRFDDVPRADDDARAWVFGIVRNVLLNDRRGERRREALGIRLADSATLVVDAHDDAVVSAVDLAAAWRRLPAAHQEVLALAAFEGLTAPQAGVVLGISPVAVRLRLTRARRALRAHLDHLPQRAATPALAGRTTR